MKEKRTFEYSHYCRIHASQGEVTDSDGSRSAYETVLKESQSDLALIISADIMRK